MAQQNRDIISSKIESLNDSITNLDIEILNLESQEISGNELGTIKYMSELLQWDIKKTANLFILILIFVFDPLAITLVIATNQAFKTNKKEEETLQVTPQVTPSVEEIVDTPKEEEPKNEEVLVPENLLTLAENFEWDLNAITEVKEEKPIVEEIIEEEPNKDIEAKNVIEDNIQQTEPVINRRLSYTKNDTGNFKINRI